MLTIKRILANRQRFLRCLFFIAVILWIPFSHYTRYFIERAHSEIIINGLSDYEIEYQEGIEVYFKDHNREYVDGIGRILQYTMKEVDNNLQRKGPKNFKAVVYPSTVEMNAGLRLSAKERTLGAYYGGNLFLLSDGAGQSGTPIENVILHEYTHLLVDEITKGNHPIWLTEGIALYQEYLITGYMWGGGDRSLEPYGLDQLQKHFYDLNTHHAYHSSFHWVMYLQEVYGNDTTLELLNQLGKGVEFTKAFESLCGKEMKEIENNFMLWYHGMNYGKL